MPHRDGTPLGRSCSGLVRASRRVTAVLHRTGSAYEIPFQGRLVGGNAPEPSPFPGAEPLFRGLHPIRNVRALVRLLRDHRLSVGRRGARERNAIGDSFPRRHARRPYVLHAGIGSGAFGATVEDHFPPARESITALFAVLLRGAKRRGIAPRRAKSRRTSATSPRRAPIYDDNSGRDEKPVQFGRKNIQLLFDTEPDEDVVTLPDRPHHPRYQRALRFRQGLHSTVPAIGASEHG